MHALQRTRRAAAGLQNRRTLCTVTGRTFHWSSSVFSPWCGYSASKAHDPDIQDILKCRNRERSLAIDHSGETASLAYASSADRSRGQAYGCTGRPWPEYRAGCGPGAVLADAETGSYRNCGILPWRLSPQCNRWEFRVRSPLSLQEIMPVAVCIGTLSAMVVPGRSGTVSDRLRNPAKKGLVICCPRGCPMGRRRLRVDSATEPQCWLESGPSATNSIV